MPLKTHLVASVALIADAALIQSWAESGVTPRERIQSDKKVASPFPKKVPMGAPSFIPARFISIKNWETYSAIGLVPCLMFARWSILVALISPTS